LQRSAVEIVLKPNSYAASGMGLAQSIDGLGEQAGVLGNTLFIKRGADVIEILTMPYDASAKAQAAMVALGKASTPVLIASATSDGVIAGRSLSSGPITSPSSRGGRGRHRGAVRWLTSQRSSQRRRPRSLRHRFADQKRLLRHGCASTASGAEASGA